MHPTISSKVASASPKASNPCYSPALRRYISEGQQKNCGSYNDREGCPKGAEGMLEYLRQWNRWMNMNGDEELGLIETSVRPSSELS